MQTFVYFAQFTDHSIKIGISHDLTKRLQALEHECGARGTFIGRLAVSHGEARILERAIHRGLGRYWMRGEWYTDCPPVREAIRRLLKDPTLVQTVIDRARRNERVVKARTSGPRPKTQVIAKVVDQVIAELGSECPDLVIADRVAQLCASYRLLTDDDSIARAIRMARVRRHRATPQSADSVRVIGRVVHECARERKYTSYADLVEDVKRRCATLAIPYSSDAVMTAIVAIEQARQQALVVAPPVEAPTWIKQDEWLGERGLSPDEARVLYEIYMARYKAEHNTTGGDGEATAPQGFPALVRVQ